MHNHKWVIICYVEPLVQVAVCRLQHLYVNLCLLQLHLFACTVSSQANLLYNYQGPDQLTLIINICEL